MSEHYFSQNPSSPHSERSVWISALGEKLLFTTDAGVFSRDGLDSGTRILLEALPPLSGRVLDLGCGWGAVGCLLAKKYPEAEFLLTDINQRAVELSQRNLQENGLKNAAAIQGDGFSSVTGAFRWILTNPPIRAGKAVIYSLFSQARSFLEPEGALVIVIRKQQGAKSAENYLRELYSQVECLDKSGGYWVLMAGCGKCDD
ncbi:MAG TPA: class I SAM-dependent methyltransferase [Candidatus Pullichristensenella excrementigallinarum]|uniref:Class I SAM-dependent methyltransferase n=1 Tax=Candidatus Pullichristensenella excrementigallinarum TaxID=2840907 RepID=A0A9D1I9C7_9FIRM|nr:class I SAM-dependent methyltransferase [Candidatus Pullichristensenella excrementigallinarum]